MITVTGKMEDVTGTALHATIDFVSKSTPLASAGIVTTNTDVRIKSNPADGTFSTPLYPGNYSVTIQANGQTSSFNIVVPDGGGSAAIDTLVSTPLAFTYTPPNSVWNGATAGHITFLPLAAPPAPTTSEVTYAGGGIDAGANHYAYYVSYVTQTGETVCSPLAAVNYTSGTPTANSATRVTLQLNPAGVTEVKLWRTYIDTGSAYDPTTFPHNVGLLAALSPATAYYDDWETTAQFAARVDTTQSPQLFNSTSGALISNGTVIALFSPQGLEFPGANVRFTPGVGLELFNFNTQQWHTLVATGSPATLGLSPGHA